MNAQLPVNLPNLEEIENGFVRAMDLYETAFIKIAEADEAIKRAYATIATVTPGHAFHSDRDAREISEFQEAVKLPNRDLYLRTARKLMNLRCWHYVVDRCGLTHLMDAQAKKELEKQFRYVPERSRNGRELIDQEEAAKGPPPFTADNARATMADFAAQSQMIWRRGIANAFSQLDRRFRSHDGFKVGSRVILTRLANEYGSIDNWGNRADTFRDIERTFKILDGQDPRQATGDFLYRIGSERSGYNPRQSEHYSEYFKVVVYKNGNAHLWFQRDDLVKLVNLELAAHYGEVIGDGQTKEPDPLESRAVTHARAFGFFPTSHWLSEKIAALMPYSERSLRILEPSAGTGNLASALAKPKEIHDRGQVVGRIRHRIDCIEIQPELAAALRNSGKFNAVATADFLKSPPTAIYDGVVMNPPFDMERDIDHVTWALKFLKPDGFLLAIMSAGTEFRETRKAGAFRKLLADRKGWMIDLPDGSFADVGTQVNTVLVGIGGRSKPYRVDHA